ncbi:helix-turn-helix domain-containing protein [Nocardia rhizosphaerae]|uniref:Helix-turn-helix domain-containing protein n=1 Tax=Nocardia rhizosphaerae TaxID=1691571 RepID=A0ABV8L296_9NOCA
MTGNDAADDAARRRAIGAAIQQERLSRHLSANAFARLAGVNIRTVSNLESAETWPWEANRTKIEAALGWEQGILDRWRTDPSIDLSQIAARIGSAREGSSSGRKPRSDAPLVQVKADFATGALGQLRAANIAFAAERLTLLPAEDIAKVQQFIDALGRARFSDWDDQGDYDLAWNRRAKLAPLSPTDEEAVLDSLDDVD